MEAKHVLVWRLDTRFDYEFASIFCPYCNCRMASDVVEERNEVDGVQRWVDRQCLLCGWQTVRYRNEPEPGQRRLGFGFFPNPPWNGQSVLKVLDLNSSELALDELGAHLRRNYSDIYSLDSYRFEVLIADIFASHGYEASFTQRTRDGGVDVFLLNQQNGTIDAVIEVKRYAQERRVGIATVQRVAGVAIEWDSKRAIVVTTANFTRDAISSARRINSTGLIGLDLVGATELLKLLGVYNLVLPPLDQMTQKYRDNLIRENILKWRTYSGNM